MGYAQNITDTGSQAAGYSQTVASVTFTAVANRYYRITYYEPTNIQVGAGGYIYMQIKNGATILNSGSTNPSTFGIATVSAVKTFSAGSVTLSAVWQVVTNNCRALRGSVEQAFILVEDIGLS
jgi:hypothetical protein